MRVIGGNWPLPTKTKLINAVMGTSMKNITWNNAITLNLFITITWKVWSPCYKMVILKAKKLTWSTRRRIEKKSELGWWWIKEARLGEACIGDGNVISLISTIAYLGSGYIGLIVIVIGCKCFFLVLCSLSCHNQDHLLLSCFYCY